MTATTNFGEITSSLDDPASKLAYSIFLDRIISFVGAYIVKLGGPSKIDALVFAGGIGEHSAKLRSDVTSAVECVGFKVVDEERNGGPENLRRDGGVVEISRDEGDGVRSFVCWTDEQVRAESVTD